ncbi:hypothetical protein BDZ91DRAFT_714239 [Kalaharituber pfeilii]|nr:hypothetical protein BDZ91DRAFT_714239 [Kalaharituber pfeilii]
MTSRAADGTGMDIDPEESTGPAVTADGALAATVKEAEALKREISQESKRIIEETEGNEVPTAKKARLEERRHDARDSSVTNGDRKKGVAPVKAEYLVISEAAPPPIDDDAAESGTNPHTSKNAPVGSSSGPVDDRDRLEGGKKRKKERGQNKGRKFHFSHDAVQLCPHLSQSPSTNKPLPCGRISSNGSTEDAEEAPNGKGGANGCTFEHDIKKYLAEGKKPDLKGVCPVWNVRGECTAGGWRCRWLGSHVRELDNGEKELVADDERKKKYLEHLKQNGKGNERKADEGASPGIVNDVEMKYKIQLRKNKFEYPKSNPYLDWIEKQKEDEPAAESNASYVEARFKKHEKRALDITPNQPLLAPLTTVGNLPFRRLCKSLGAAITYSEMAMSLPLLQGQKSEWALLRAHASEMPNFGVQICAMKPWQAIKATEAITTLIPSHSLSLVDLNCGCPIDLVYRSGGGSALLDQHGKLFKMLKGMAYVSGETPISCKIRMGTKDASPNAKKLLYKLWDSGDVSAVTLHGRSRQQRYTRAADWEYISECAALIQDLKADMEKKVDTAEWKEKHDGAQIAGSGTVDKTVKTMHFIGNGDVYSHADYFAHTTAAPLSSVMVARGALIKPWVFEEISAGQYLDKSATERLEYVRQFVRYGLETRFLLEWLSFTCRYVPVGILEVLPPRIQDRPPCWRGRDELETLLGSGDYRDWIKISEMFLGPTPPSFEFKPKHKSNAYGEIEAEG